MSPPCLRLSTLCSVNISPEASICPAASGKSSPSRVTFTAGRRSSFSTSPPQPSTARPSTPYLDIYLAATIIKPKSSCHTNLQTLNKPIILLCSVMAASLNKALTLSSWPRAPITPDFTGCNQMPSRKRARSPRSYAPPHPPQFARHAPPASHPDMLLQSGPPGSPETSSVGCPHTP